MTNIFNDSYVFMTACDQTTDGTNKDQYEMYLGLIDEEYNELVVACQEEDRVKQLDGLIDIMVVTSGAILSGFGPVGEAAWKEVMDTNFAKINVESGKVRRRADGKILKPEGWKDPNLSQFIK